MNSTLLDHVRTLKPRTWAEALEGLAAELRGTGWIFRGQRDAGWPLMSSLERAAAEFGVPLDQLVEIERDFITRFYRNAHLYIPNPFDESRVLETLSVMQHHGAPTRLLDCSYSFYVAAYFALEAQPGPSGCAVWAINHHWLRASVQDLLSETRQAAGQELLLSDPEVRRPETFKSIFMSVPPISLAYQLSPYRFNQRLVIQQGTFLCPGNVSCPFEENLTAVPGYLDHVMRIVIPESERVEGLRQLHFMNMNASTLFPGLDGFAQSFRIRLPFKWRRV